MRRLALLAWFAAIALAVITPSLSAQRAVSGSSLAGQNFAASHHHRSFPHPPVFFSDPFYSDALFGSGYPAASQPPVIILQAPPAADAIPAVRPSPPAQPLLIELQGDRYVRVSGEDTSGAEMIDRSPAPSRRAARQSYAATELANRQSADRELAAVVLIFRDGHREEVSDYTIADGILYTGGDYYTDGSWNKRIELQSLNLLETVKSNQARGARFRIPQAPNEVIVGP